MLIREFHRQIINLLREGQISLAAIHAYENQSIELDEQLICKFVEASVFSEFIALTGELNGGQSI